MSNAPHSPAYANPLSTSTESPSEGQRPYALFSLISGIAAFVLGLVPILGLVLGVTAIVFGVLALRARQSKGMFIAGVATGAVGAFWSLITTGALLLGAGLIESENAEVPSEPLMPDVVGSALSLARSDIERSGYDESVEVIGGGLFGILDEDAWEVCDQLPAAGEPILDEPRLTVERNCGVDAESAPPSDAPIVDEPIEEEAEVPEEEPEEVPEDSGIDAAEIEAKFLEHLDNNFIESIESMCDASYTHWACYTRNNTNATIIPMY